MGTLSPQDPSLVGSAGCRMSLTIPGMFGVVLFQARLCSAMLLKGGHLPKGGPCTLWALRTGAGTGVGGSQAQKEQARETGRRVEGLGEPQGLVREHPRP